MNLVDSGYLKSLPGAEDITRVVLANGITVLTRPNFNSASVVLTGYLNSGSLFEPDELMGLARFTAAALMRGTQKRNFQKIYDTLESIGASFGFGVGVHNTNFGGRALAEDLPVLLETLSECLLQPIFPAEQIERLRAQLLTGLTIRDQDTDAVAGLVFDEEVFRQHPYHRPDEGHPETVARITRQDIASFHQKYYGPRDMVVIIVGAVEPQAAVELVQKALGHWSNPAQIVPPTLPLPTPLDQTVRKHIAIPGKMQTALEMGTLGPLRVSPDFVPLSLGNNILGQFGMMGRIGEVVREQSGLAYHASSNLSAWIAGGAWKVGAGVNPANLQRAIDLIRLELERFVNEPVSQDELEDSKSNYIGRLPLSMESNAGVAGALEKLERFQLGLDYYKHYPVMIKSVTPQMILESARHYLDARHLVIISAGPDLDESSA